MHNTQQQVSETQYQNLRSFLLLHENLETPMLETPMTGWTVSRACTFGTQEVESGESELETTSLEYTVGSYLKRQIMAAREPA